MKAAAEIYADPQHFAAWLDRAAPGESFLYAIAAHLDAGRPVVRAVKAAREAGTVVPVQGGREGERRYQVQRSGHALTGGRAAPARQLPRLAPALAASAEGALFVLLCEIADAGLPCPSNGALARRLGWSDGGQVNYRLRLLRREGHVAVSLTDGPMRWRTITITETGARTAGPPSSSKQTRATPMARRGERI